MRKRVVRKIKIAHVTGWLHVGGKENGMVNLVNAMPADIFENHIYVFVAGGILRQRLDPNQCHVVELGNKLGNDYSLYFKLASLFHKHRIDIAHTRSWGTLLEGMLAAKAAGVPAIIHGEHGFLKADTKKHILIQRLLWRTADQVMCVSEALRDKIAATIGFPKDRIHVIKNGVDINRYNLSPNGNDFKAAMGFPTEDFLFGSIGRLVPVKDYATLLRAAKVVMTSVPNSQLIFVGDGPRRHELEVLANDLGIAGRVHFLKWSEEVPRIMAALDVFVLSSISEGMSNSILEAMCSCKPVVATAVGGNPELVVDGKTGILVPSKDPQQMGHAILELLRDSKKRRRMGEAGRQRVEAEFSLPQMIRNYEKMYVRVASRRFTFHPELREKIDRHFVTHESSPQPALAE